jgi:peptidoglycan/xylan/chitin deacetylase (PgdA/CDA1 family)
LPSRHATSSTQLSSAAFVSSGPRDKQRVALTFHTNGERALAETLLTTLAAHRTPITAFIVGSWLEANTDFAKRITDAGHELANHTYSHPTFPTLGEKAMTQEVTRCRDILTSLAGSGDLWFRPSGTTNGTDEPAPTILKVAATAGYSTVVGFDVDPSDYLDPGATAIAQRVMGAVQPGSIVSLHFGHQHTIDAVPTILRDLDRRGLEAVTLTTLLLT